LRIRGGAKVGFAVVKAITVYMVDEKRVGDIEDLAVHFDGKLFFLFGVPDFSLRVAGISGLIGVPPVHTEAWIVIRVNDSELVLCEADSSEGAAEPQATIEENEPKRYAFEPRGNF
jgi:hypothetical protein